MQDSVYAQGENSKIRNIFQRLTEVMKSTQHIKCFYFPHREEIIIRKTYTVFSKVKFPPFSQSFDTKFNYQLHFELIFFISCKVGCKLLHLGHLLKRLFLSLNCLGTHVKIQPIRKAYFLGSILFYSTLFYSVPTGFTELSVLM